MGQRRVYFLCLMSLLILVAAGLSQEAYGADYAVYSKPLYGADVQNDPDASSSTFTMTVDWFMTASAGELNNAISNGWVSRGVVCYTSPAQVPGTIPLYRLYNPSLTDHVYTTNPQEYNVLQSVFYVPEGIVGYVFPKTSPVPGAVPLHRFYAGSSHAYHRYSLNPAKTMQTENYEGVECYVWPQGQAVVTLDITRPTYGMQLNGLSTIDISWNRSTNGGYIALHYSTDAGNTWIPIGYGYENTGFAKWRVPNVDTDHARVKATWTDNLFGETTVLASAASHYDFKIRRTVLQQSAAAQAVPKFNPPSAPTALTAKFAMPVQAQLSWQPSAGAPISYTIERRTADSAYQQTANVKAPTLTYVDRGVSPGTTYFYRVCAVSIGGKSGYSNEVSVKTAFTLQKPVAAVRSVR